MLRLPSPDTVEVCVDEVGRGCLMGDVVAGAVVLPASIASDPRASMIRDSKRLSAKKREVVAAYIKEVAVVWAVGAASPVEIDRHNILKATHMAMHRALDVVARSTKFDVVLVDGDRFTPYMPPPPPVDGNSTVLWPEDASWVPHECVVDGDNKIMGIAAASILAKVHRDAMVLEAVAAHPEWDIMYAFTRNKGYGTKHHMTGLATHGAIPHVHRASFAPVARVHPGTWSRV